MNGIQGEKPARQQWNPLLGAVITILKYLKITIFCSVYIKVFSNGTVSYIMVSNDVFLNTTNNETAFNELRIVFEEVFDIKVQEGSVLKYLNLRIYQSYLGFSVDHTDHIM